jgi:hypothetical protein
MPFARRWHQRLAVTGNFPAAPGCRLTSVPEASRLQHLDPPGKSDPRFLKVVFQVAISPAERNRRYRARLRGEEVPLGKPGRPRYGPESPADVLRRLGFDVGDQQQVEDLLAARRSRDRLDQQEAAQRVDDLARGLRRAKRAESLILADWRAGQVSLAAAEEALRNTATLEADLPAACHNDEQMITEAEKRAAE